MKWSDDILGIEMWDIYDKNRNKTGRTHKRVDKMNAGNYHLVVHVCLFNIKNEMIIQKRHSKKRLFPGRWDLSSGGAAIEGESSYQAAERELFEELGIQIDLSDVRPHITVHFEDGFDDYYLITSDIEIESIVLEINKLEDVVWASKDTIVRLIEEKRFMNYHKSFIETLFDMHSHRGTLL